MDGNKSVTAGFAALPVLTSIIVAPASASVNASATQQFTATGYDQNGALLSPQPIFTWTVSGGGSIDASGLFTAGATASVAPITVTAQSGGARRHRDGRRGGPNAGPTIAPRPAPIPIPSPAAPPPCRCSATTTPARRT